MRSRLLRKDYDTSWKYQVEQPISDKTKLRMTAACLFGGSQAPSNKFRLIDQSLVSYAVIAFSLGYFLSL